MYHNISHAHEADHFRALQFARGFIMHHHHKTITGTSMAITRNLLYHFMMWIYAESIKSNFCIEVQRYLH